LEHVTLREARSSDAPLLLSLAREAYREVLSLQFDGWDDDVHGARFEEKVASLPFFVAELNGEPVAAVSSSIHDDHLRVNELVVLPSFQNRGLGSFLLLRELERARSVGLPVRLHTLRLNRARAFYERHGFMVTAQRTVARSSVIPSMDKGCIGRPGSRSSASNITEVLHVVAT
jgi:GNAT superfamily N-acetyltransferase